MNSTDTRQAEYTEPTATFDRDGHRYERVPCCEWACKRPHDTLRSGPTLAGYHRVEEP